MSDRPALAPAAWAPPRGSVEVEPGFWMTRNGSVYESPESTEAREAERDAALKAEGRDRREREVRERPALIARLRDRCEQLETRAYLAEECLAAATQLLDEKVEELAFADDLLEAVLAENRRPVELRRVA